MGWSGALGLSDELDREPPDGGTNLRRTGSWERAPKSLAAVVVLAFPGDFMAGGLHLVLSPGEKGGSSKCRQGRECEAQNRDEPLHEFILNLT